MPAYHSHLLDDEFSPKKYAVVSAVKDMFKYEAQGHREEEEEKEDMLYEPQKLYGKDDAENPLGGDYLKRGEEEDREKKEKELKGIERNVADELKGSYKSETNDEIARTLFNTNQHAPLFREERDEDASHPPPHGPAGGADDEKKKAEEKSKSFEDIISGISWNTRKN
jgi:hypothetical protein